MFGRLRLQMRVPCAGCTHTTLNMDKAQGKTKAPYCSLLFSCSLVQHLEVLQSHLHHLAL